MNLHLIQKILLAAKGGIDPDAVLFLTASGITGGVITNAVNYLVIELKKQSLWTKFKAIYPLVGGTAFTHKWNLKDARDLDIAYRVLWQGSILHNSSGSTPLASGGRGNTYFQVWENGMQNDISMSLYVPNKLMLPNTSGLLSMGSTVGAISSYSMYFNRTNYNLAADFGSNFQFANFSYNNIPQNGLITGSRISANSLKVFHNGVLKVQNTNNNTGTINTIPIHIHGNLATPINQTASFASISTGLTESEISIFYSIVQQFQTILGRQV